MVSIRAISRSGAFPETAGGARPAGPATWWILWDSRAVRKPDPGHVSARQEGS